jgi:CheY-like chemotaxis protein
VLVVEDDPDNARLVEYILAREGYRVEIVDHAESALEFANQARRSDPFDVVVTDIVLPGLDGLELARVLRTIEPDLPVITMTAHSTPEHAERARALGITEYLHKPLMTPALIRSIERAIQSTDRREVLT